MPVLRLDYRPHIERGGYHLDRFTVELDGVVILRATRSPLYAGARELLRRGIDPNRLMTIRLADRDYDSFVPATVGHLAQWSITELKAGGLRRTAWQPVHIGGEDGDGLDGTEDTPPESP